jgi:uncharacterized protein (DUF1015 family)
LQPYRSFNFVNKYMSNIQPFAALRPQPQLAKQVASKPYDVLSSAEAKIEAQGNPLSFLHITKSEISLPDDVDVHSQEVYDKAKENLQAFLSRDILFKENKPCYYIYTLVMQGRSQTGLVAASSITDYENNLIKKHEFTRPEKEKDRIDHMATIGAQTGNVFLAYKDVASINHLITNWKTEKSPVYDFTAEDEIQHTIWIVNEEETIEKITQLFATEVPCTYIADGHHRAASAAKVKNTLGNNATKNAQYFLTTLFPASELAILDYNRVIKDLNAHTEATLLNALAQNFEVTKAADAVKPSQLHQFGMYLNKQWYTLKSKPGTFTNTPIGVLDVTILSDNILAPIFGITDQRTDKRIDFVGGIRGLAELEKRVDSGEMAIAFSLYPVSLPQLFDIADSGNVMPPKSTWFEPKLRDGLLTNVIA